MTGTEIPAEAIVAALRKLYPSPATASDFPTGFSRSGAYCIAGSLFKACNIDNLYAYNGTFPRPNAVDWTLQAMGVPAYEASRAAIRITNSNDRREFELAYAALVEALAAADPVKLRAAIPHELWPQVTLDEVIEATEAAQDRREVVQEVLLVQEVVYR